jgi:adenylosuccinate synthase
MKDKLVVILSGEIAAGKTTLAEKLSEDFDFKILKTREALQTLFEKEINEETPDRSSLQKFGEQLDTKSNGEWVMNHFQSHVRNNQRVIIDAARIKSQIDAFRNAYGYHVVHIHLKASVIDLEYRFVERGIEKGKFTSKGEALKKYSSYKADKTEAGVNQLEAEADLVIDTSIYQNSQDTFLSAASFLKLLPPIDTQLVDVVIGGQFGSEGKGQVVAYIAPEYDCLIRVGGPNAGHKVFHQPNPDTFHLIPSGSRRASNAKIIIGPGAVLSEEVLLKEILDFEIEKERLVIDGNATIISSRDMAWEAKNDGIGSTKQGVGKATAQNILHRIKGDEKFKAKNQRRLKGYIGSAHEEYERLYAKGKRLLLEGTQGTFLSLHHGFYPFVTSRDTTVSGCIAEAGISPRRIRKIIMVVRRYPIRVQNPETGMKSSGDFFSKEITLEEIAKRSGLSLEELQRIETTSTTKKKRRIAEFNWALFRRACELNSPTDIALTFADYINKDNRNAMRYSQLTEDTMRFVEEIERCSGISTSLIATEFSYRAIIDRRNW